MINKSYDHSKSIGICVKKFLQLCYLFIFCLMFSCAKGQDDTANYAPNQYYAPQRPYDQPRNQPYSRQYRNPYDLPQRPYYDSDQYYIPPSGYSNGDQSYPAPSSGSDNKY